MKAAALAAMLAAAPASAEITGARFVAPTDRYTHDVLGGTPAWGAMEITRADGAVQRIVLPETRVFEDLAPRLVDVTGDGAPELVVVESHVHLGAALAIYGAEGRIAATPHIGRANRWLAPVGVGDLNGDGRVELAYIDRPHLARVLRVWRFAGGTLHEVAARDGLTNHRIGEDFITGGLRDCGAGPEMIVASADWGDVVAVTLAGDALEARVLGPATEGAFARALDCRDPS